MSDYALVHRSEKAIAGRVNFAQRHKGGYSDFEKSECITFRGDGKVAR